LQEEQEQRYEQERRAQEHLAFLKREDQEKQQKMSLKNQILTMILTTHLGNPHLNAKKWGF
jgi:hypothetical protein